MDEKILNEKMKRILENSTYGITDPVKEAAMLREENYQLKKENQELKEEIRKLKSDIADKIFLF